MLDDGGGSGGGGNPNAGNYCAVHPSACNGGGGGNNDDNDDEHTGGGGGGGGQPLLSPNLENNDFSYSYSYCGGGPNGWYNFFDCGANVTQDLALVIDIPFAGLDAWLITLGCFDGPAGCLAGALVADTIFNLTAANANETALSAASAVFSIFADLNDDDRQIGESSVVSVAAAGVGALSQDPILDFAIDGFGAGYNHDVKPISSFVPFIRSLFSH